MTTYIVSAITLKRQIYYYIITHYEIYKSPEKKMQIFLLSRILLQKREKPVRLFYSLHQDKIVDFIS